MDTERAICHRLEAVPPYLESIAEGNAGQFRPSRVCIVAPNEWGGHMALKLAVEILTPCIPGEHIGLVLRTGRMVLLRRILGLHG